MVDGGSEDDTVAEARAAGAAASPRRGGEPRSVTPAPRAAKGDILLFLHADSTLPPAYDEHIVRAFGDDATNGRRREWGAFRFALDSDDGGGARDLRLERARAAPRVSLYDLVCSYLSGPRRRLLEAAVNVRTAVFRRPYGDQGLLVRKTRFDALGGFASMPFLEDVELVSRLNGGAPRRRSPNASVTALGAPLRARRYVRTSLLNQAIVLGYACGVPVERLRAWRAVRPMGGRRVEASAAAAGARRARGRRRPAL